ncbi:hypothetical protein ID144_08660 [Pseudomonas sp. JM0905a]|uniref:hypothetical protein n=1 Tax=Pseudomonas sp. JM0905a TaxID=2772484 RepID=UPI001682316C|nr:hypothetical protein [Pseudomonas sp. JM0905a]MBD2837105.1 hypothetical protein [Pseudomonas sp. JM0905a]
MDPSVTPTVQPQIGQASSWPQLALMLNGGGGHCHAQAVAILLGWRFVGDLDGSVVVRPNDRLDLSNVRPEELLASVDLIQAAGDKQSHTPYERRIRQVTEAIL